jgi:hypothetical protein
VNPEKAYNLHTDWARAALRDGSSHHRWFESRLRSGCTPLANAGAFRQFMGGDDSVESMRAFGPVVDVVIVTDVEVGATPPEPVVSTDVYSAEPPPPQAGSLDTQIIAVREEVYTRTAPTMLAAAPTYYVTADMVTVMEVAAAAFDDTDLMPSLPSSSGFVVLARPLVVPDDQGEQLVHAFAWSTWGQALTVLGTPGEVGEVWSFASRGEAHDPMVAHARNQWDSATAWRRDPDLLPLYGDRFITGGRVGGLLEDLAEVQATQQARRWLYEQSQKFRGNSDQFTDQFDTLLQRAQDRIARDTPRLRAELGDKQQVGRMQPYLAAFVLLLTQQITDTQPVTQPVDAVRRARAVRAPRPSTVTVVDVRHRTGTADSVGDPSTAEPGGARRRALDHRHLVGSHWKWQPWGPERSLRRRIFVAGYVRGPEDKPLKVTPRVTRL